MYMRRYSIKYSAAACLLGLFLPVAAALASEQTGTISTGVSTGLEGTVIAAPTASPAAGTYTSSQNVTLSAPGASSIHYTTDGSTPTCTTGSVYTDDISVSSSRVIKALSCYANGLASSVASFAYVIQKKTGGGGGGGGGGGAWFVSPTFCTLTSPNGGETYIGGAVTNVVWTASGPEIVKAELHWSVDGGATWGLFHAPGNNLLSYVWDVPNTPTTQGKVRVDCLDTNGNVVVSDSSDGVFTINRSPTLPETPPPAEHTTGIYSRTTANGILPPSAPVDSLVKLPNDGNPATDVDTAVYYVGLDAKRHPFPTAQIYFTWYENFNLVKEIPAATLASIPLGDPILARPGTYWVKIQTDPKTYYVEPGSFRLRWVMDEATAVLLGGPNWNRNIIDVDPSYFISYLVGDPISTSTLAADWPAGALVKLPTETSIWYVTKTTRRAFASYEVFQSNYFQSRFIQTSTAAGWQAVPVGDSITGWEDELRSLSKL